MFIESMQDRAIRLIWEGALKARGGVTQFISSEIQRTKTSKEWKWMIAGDDYYIGRHDILRKKRTAIGENGALTEIANLPNSQVLDNVYRRMVKQKSNYLLGKPFSINCDNEAYRKLLTYYLDKAFFRKLKNVGVDSLNCGLGWLYVYYDEMGELRFKRFRPYEIIPEWRDVDHTELDAVIRFYEIVSYEGEQKKKVTKVEYYTLEGIQYFEFYNGSLVQAPPYWKPYFEMDGQALNWSKLPFIPFRYNENELPLIVNAKSLQDALNIILSNFQDNMVEDSRNTILVLVNYDGQNLGEFRQNLATYGAVKVRSTEGANGDVRTLRIEVNAENYKVIVGIFKKAIIENCMGYDAKDEKLSGTPNQMNIQSMYNDIDLDASDMEMEYQAALDELLYFIDLHLENTGAGDFSQEEVQIVFNTNMPMDESMTIQNAQNSVGIISKRTITAHHPWVTDLDAELAQLEKEEGEAQERQYEIFGSPQDAKDSEEE